jgi:hypothetical protein
MSLPEQWRTFFDGELANQNQQNQQKCIDPFTLADYQLYSWLKSRHSPLTKFPHCPRKLYTQYPGI